MLTEKQERYALPATEVGLTACLGTNKIKIDMTAEEKVAQAALQEASKIKIGGRTFKAHPPAIATLIKVSACVSQLPQMDIDKNDPIGETLRVAKDCGVLSDLAATMILGARGRFPIFDALVSIPYRIRYAFLRWFVENKVTPAELQQSVVELLVNRMQTAFFLSTITSLAEINTTKPTRTTPPGQQS